MSRRTRSRFARLFARPLEDRVVPATTFQVLSLGGAGGAVAEHAATTGPDQGGVAVSPSKVFVTGQSATGRFNLADLTAPATGPRFDGLVGNLRNGTVYALAQFDFFSGTVVPINAGAAFAGTTVDHLLEVNGTTGALTGTQIPLSAGLFVQGGTGVFAGYDRILLSIPGGFGTDTVWEIDLTAGNTGTVTNLNTITSPAHMPSATWAYWGTAEHFGPAGGQDYLNYVRTPVRIARTNVQTGATTDLATFTNLGDMASFSASLSNNRWYFHNQGPSQFSPTAAPNHEIVGYAPATFRVGDFIVTNTNDFGAGSLRQVIADANATGAAQSITFQAGVTGTINLSSPVPVTQPVGVLGPGSLQITVAGSGANSLFAPTGSGQLTLSGLTLSKPAADGLNVGYALTAAGDLQITAGTGNVSFANPLTVQAGFVAVTDGNAVDLGPTTVVNGTLQATSAGGFNLPAGASLTGIGGVMGRVDVGGTLGGSLAVNGNVLVKAGGTVSPGPGVATVSVGGDLTFQAGGTFTADMNVGGNGDQITVAGAVDLGPTNMLNPVFTSVPNPGDAFELISNAGSDAIVGLLDGVRNRSGKALGGQFYQVRYDGGTGNDLELVANNSPVLDPAADTDLTPILEDITPASNPGTPVADLVATQGLYTDFQGGVRSGLAFTGADGSAGTWQYSRNAGTAWADFGTLSAAGATLLEADGAGQNRIRFQPNGNFFGRATISFKAWDTTDGKADGTVNADTGVGGGNNPYSSATESAGVDVLAVNDAPAPVNDTHSVAEDGTLTVAAAGVLANDVDIDGPFPLIAALVGGPAHGSLNVNADGSFSYTPTANYNGPDQFTYKATDGHGAYGVAVVNLTVTSVNDSPVAGNDLITLPEDGGTVPVDVLANDTAAPDTGETLTVSAVTQGVNGTVAIAANSKSVTYTPVKDYNGPDTFTYTVSDGNGGSVTATVNVTVSAVNDPPVAVTDTATATEDAGGQAILVLNNDTTGPDAGESLTVSTVTQGLHGTVTIAADGKSVVYTPAPNFAGPDQFIYTISDGNGGTASAAVVVTVNNDHADRLEVVTSTTTSRFDEPVPQPVPPAPPVLVAVDDQVQIGSGLEGILTGATVKFVAGFVAKKDTLVFFKDTARPTIKGSFNPAKGVLTLTGVATPSEYEAALRSVKYTNKSPMPVDGIRTIAIQVKDAAGFGDPGYKLLQVVGVNTAPTLTLPATLAPAKFKLGKPAVAVAGPLKIKDVDNTRLQRATVTIGTNAQAADQLLINKLTEGTTSGIQFKFENGVMTLTGNATIATYLKVLKLVKFTTTTGIGLNRRLDFQVNDGDLNSLAVSREVMVV